VFRALKLAVRLKNQEKEDESWSQKVKGIFKFAHETVTALLKTELYDVALRLFLQCALVADKCGAAFETIGYEFVTQAFVIYEEHVSDSQAHISALISIIGTLQMITIFGEESYDTFTTKAAQHSSKLLKKPDQCRAICLCSHLFWSTNPAKENKNGKRVLECLQKSLKIADTCVDSSTNVRLFVEILNEYLYYFENSCEAVTIQYLSGLIALINTNIANMDTANSNTSGTSTDAPPSGSGPETAKIISHYQNTINFIKWKREVVADARYREIQI